MIINKICILRLDYDWRLTENSTVVDVGSRNGGLLLEILNRYKTKGIIYDLPEVTINLILFHFVFDLRCNHVFFSFFV